MLKKTITYEDFNGETVSEDFFFHLSKAELVELELSHEGGLSESLAKIVAVEDGKAIVAEFKNIILGSYGQRSTDGKRFVKNQLLRDEFESSEAYSVLFMELVTDVDSAINFINGIIPAGMAEQAANAVLVSSLESVDNKPVLESVPKPEPIIVTRAEVIEMSYEDLTKLGERLASGEVKIGE
jgi:hypothetical protein